MGCGFFTGDDLAKCVFQAHGAADEGSVVFRKKLSRGQLHCFRKVQETCEVDMETCATPHFWAREIEELGHCVRLMPPFYVKPFVKRHKNDAVGAEAITLVATRPTMRFVPIKSPDQQARAMVFRTRDLFVRQQTQLINALRWHLDEHGLGAARGPAQLSRLLEALEEDSAAIPRFVREAACLYLEQIRSCGEKFAGLDRTLRVEVDRSAMSRRLQTMPGIGPITAMAIEAFAPPMESFRRGRDTAAWLGLVPRQHSTGGKQPKGRRSKMGQHNIRRLLIIGAMAVGRLATRSDRLMTPWLACMRARKSRMGVAIALANTMAPAVWAMATQHEDYRTAGELAA